MAPALHIRCTFVTTFITSLHVTNYIRTYVQVIYLSITYYNNNYISNHTITLSVVYLIFDFSCIPSIINEQTILSISVIQKHRYNTHYVVPNNSIILKCSFITKSFFKKPKTKLCQTKQYITGRYQLNESMCSYS